MYKSNSLVSKENTLIKKCLKGNESAQRALYLNYRVRWYMMCLRYAQSKPDADDMLQEGLIAIFRDMKQFDRQKGSFGAWSNRVLVNAILQFLRKWKKIKLNSDVDDFTHILVEKSNIYDQMSAKELTSLVQKLPTGYRTVFNLHVIEGYKHQEIAEMLDISESTSKTQLLKAKKMLRMKLENILQS